MSVEVSKYIRAGEHPLAPFTIRVVLDNADVNAALKLLDYAYKQILSIGQLKVHRHPKNCELFIKAEPSRDETKYYITCKGAKTGERLFVMTKEGFEAATEAAECLRCEYFKQRKA